MLAPAGSHPELIIRLDTLRRNAGVLTHALAEKGIVMRGVVKACQGDMRIASAFLQGGANGLADSRADNLSRLRAAFPSVELAMLRPAPQRELAAAIWDVDLFLTGNMPLLEDLAALATTAESTLRVIIMLETGGEREGMSFSLAREAMHWTRQVASLELVGLGTHTTCRGISPPPSIVQHLLDLAEEEKGCFQTEEPVISAGNSSMLLAALAGELPAGVELRIGEAVLLGRETTRGEELEGLSGEAFTLLAEVVETKEERGEDGHYEPRSLVATGRSDLGAGSLIPRVPGLRVVEYFGDLTLLAGEGPSGSLRRGETLAFSLDYQGVLGAMAGPYVSREYRESDAV
jgi:predicted amino acid racemase